MLPLQYLCYFSIKKESSRDLISLFRSRAVMYEDWQRKVSHNAVELQDGNNRKYNEATAWI